MTQPKTGIENKLKEITQVIVEQVHPKQIILFGSHARGDARLDSDLDLLIIERQPFGPGRSRRKEAARLWRTLARFHVPIDLVLYSEQEVEGWRDSTNHVTARALRKGRILYG